MTSEDKTKNKSEKIAAWIRTELQNNGKATFQSWHQQFEGASNREKEVHRPTWNRAVHVLSGYLNTEKENPVVAIEKGDLILRRSDTKERPELESYRNARFDPSVNSIEKDKIGTLVANFLADPQVKDKTVFLGSGTTIFHVGLKMLESEHQYNQRFVTVNIPLAARWCTKLGQKIDRVSIPEAVLETQTFRFSTMPGLRWPLTITILGADGCFYDEGEKEMVLYGNEESVAANTSLFVRRTLHTVVFCLTSSKIRLGYTQILNTGPPISSPLKGVIRVLVTDPTAPDQKYEKTVNAFGKDGWMIVSKSTDWDAVKKAMEEGEKAVRST